MKKPKSIFLIIYFIFHVLLLVVSIYVNYRSEDFEFLLWLRGKMDLMVYVSAIGMILFFVNVLISGLDARSHSKEKSALEQEVNALKAKMFDLQEATSTPKKKEAKPEVRESEEKEDSGADE
ncbi:hypothetical protein [Fulvivirga lutea]|uniref:LapA family protein n=1 Tax=Fulvivirga lutea TaxID=2810512 RepID=A0A974WNV0_9BACT|nr:hypothetical protein [Fulvivirga lutea]QSE98913.1 hypothetical protein JR347_07475 [Fulvivirga lutea]